MDGKKWNEWETNGRKHFGNFMDDSVLESTEEDNLGWYEMSVLI